MEQKPDRQILRVAAMRASDRLRHRAALALIGCVVITVAGSVLSGLFDVDPLVNVVVAMSTMGLGWYAGRNALEASRLTETLAPSVSVKSR